MSVRFLEVSKDKNVKLAFCAFTNCRFNHTATQITDGRTIFAAQMRYALFSVSKNTAPVRNISSFATRLDQSSHR